MRLSKRWKLKILRLLSLWPSQLRPYWFPIENAACEDEREALIASVISVGSLPNEDAKAIEKLKKVPASSPEEIAG